MVSGGGGSGSVVPAYVSPPFWGIRDRMGLPRPQPTSANCSSAESTWEDAWDYF